MGETNIGKIKEQVNWSSKGYLYWFLGKRYGRDYFLCLIFFVYTIWLSLMICSHFLKKSQDMFFLFQKNSFTPLDVHVYPQRIRWILSNHDVQPRWCTTRCRRSLNRRSLRMESRYPFQNPPRCDFKWMAKIHIQDGYFEKKTIGKHVFFFFFSESVCFFICGCQRMMEHKKFNGKFGCFFCLGKVQLQESVWKGIILVDQALCSWKTNGAYL